MAIAVQNKKDVLSGFNQTITRHPALYGFFLVFAILAGAFFGLIVPAVRALQIGGAYSQSDLDQKISEAQAKLDVENKTMNALVSLSDADRAKIEYALPGEPDSPGLLAQIAAVVRAGGGTLGSVDFSLAAADPLSAAGKGIGAVDISMNINGMDYNKFKILLNLIEYNLRIIDVKNFVFSGSAASLSLNLRTYYRK